MPSRRLGRSELKVSRLSLGSWRTFERISREDGPAVMRAALEHGINFLDDDRYNDETGRAPIPTGYSEMLFGKLFRAAGWDRARTIVANKLWWGVLSLSPAALAIAFALANPAVGSVLFGATTPSQIAETVTALDVDAATVQRLLDV